MSNGIYYLLCALLSVGVLVGIKWMSSVETAVKGNRLSALCMLAAIITTLIKFNLLALPLLWAGLALGTLVGLWLTFKVKMIQMPQMVALLNGLGGGASAITAGLTLAIQQSSLNPFAVVTACLALMIGGVTFLGSLVAAGKLQRLLPQKSITLPGHQFWLILLLLLCFTGFLILTIHGYSTLWLVLITLSSLLFGYVFAIRVGGADMPIVISLLNSTSGVAAAISGMAIGDLLLVSVGGIVGASGLLLTQVMCHAMNRNLFSILLGSSHHPPAPVADEREQKKEEIPLKEVASPQNPDDESPLTQSSVHKAPENPMVAAANWLNEAESIILIPGYGMAVSQAQTLVKELTDSLTAKGKNLRFAIHPVAGRMPGHMNVLLAEVDIPYDQLYELEDINPDFDKSDAVIVIGANDVINPAANTAVDTPIYGMPVLDAEKAKRLIICNFDLSPGYAGVPNPLYEPRENIALLLGDAKESLTRLLELLS